MSADRDREEQHLREVLEQAKRASSSDERDELLDDELLAARPSRKPKPRHHRIKDEE